MSDLGEQLPELHSAEAPGVADASRGLTNAVLQIPVSVQVVIGTARLPIGHLAQLAPGSSIKLEEKLGTPARVLVNGREVARGDLYVLDGDGERLGLTITDVARSSAVSD